jgi:hypothetical protein
MGSIFTCCSGYVDSGSRRVRTQDSSSQNATFLDMGISVVRFLLVISTFRHIQYIADNRQAWTGPVLAC